MPFQVTGVYLGRVGTRKWRIERARREYRAPDYLEELIAPGVHSDQRPVEGMHDPFRRLGSDATIALDCRLAEKNRHEVPSCAARLTLVYDRVEFVVPMAGCK